MNDELFRNDGHSLILFSKTHIKYTPSDIGVFRDHLLHRNSSSGKVLFWFMDKLGTVECCNYRRQSSSLLNRAAVYSNYVDFGKKSEHITSYIDGDASPQIGRRDRDQGRSIGCPSTCPCRRGDGRSERLLSSEPTPLFHFLEEQACPL